MQDFLKVFTKFVQFCFYLSVIVLIFGFVFLYKKIDSLVSLKGKAELAVTAGTNASGGQVIQKVDICGADCVSQIDKSVSQAISTISGKTQSSVPSKVTFTPTPVPAKTQTVYIPLSGPITTTSTSWVDAPGAEVYIDLANEYGKNAYVSWDAILSVANNNGQAFARLFDVTHGIAVDGGEISVLNTAVPTQVSSARMNLWSGRNLYRVQIKSLNSFVVTFSSGRVKIAY